MFNRRTLLYGVFALTLSALVVTAGKGGKKPPPDPEPAADPAILYPRFGPKPSDVSEIWVMNDDGSNRTPVITLATHGLYVYGHYGRAGTLSWSGDNTRFLFEARTVEAGDFFDLYVSDVDGSSVTKVFDVDGVSFERLDSFDWSPVPFPGQPAGDEWIILSATSVQENFEDLYAVRSDGTGLVQLTDTAEYWEAHPEVTPDGKYVLFQRWNNRQDLSRVVKATLGTDSTSGLPTITAEECITDFAGGPLEGKNCGLIGIDPTGTYALVSQGYNLLHRWLVPLADPTEAWKTDLFETTGAWLDPEKLVYRLQNPQGEWFFATVNVFTGEEGILTSFGKRETPEGPSPRRWTDSQ